MNRLRRTFGLQPPKKRSVPTDSSMSQQWLEDESKIKECCCTFQVKYLGNIEVFESRGLEVCETAIKALRKSQKKPHKAILYISGDSLRVSDDVSQHLIVDQTIEKVSFCAPDRSHEKGFAYICRDGVTRRWMCYAFMAIKDSGERLSHAVGCAFAICLEKKQKREQDALKLSCSTASDDRGFFRTGSCRPQLPSVAQRLIDPQSAVVAKAPPSVSSQGASSTALETTVARVNGGVEFSALPVATTAPSTGSVARPRPSLSVYELRASLRIFPKLQDASPFKRDLSRRLERPPSGLQRGMGVASSGGDCILDEESLSEAEEKKQPPPFQPSSSAFSTALPATSQQTGPAVGTGEHSTSLESELSALVFPDPFSSAPVDTATIQQHLQQQQLRSGQLAGRNHLTGFVFSPAGGAALSPGPPNTGVLMRKVESPTIFSSQTTAAAGGQQYGAVHGFPPFAGGGPSVASSPLPSSLSSLVPSSVSPVGSSIATVDRHYPNSSWLSSGASNTVYAQSGMSTGNPLALPVASTGVPLGYMPPAPPLASAAASVYVGKQPVWSSAMPTAADANYPSSVSRSSSAWLSSFPLLLPPVPDRYSDPFDLGWVERATAVLNQSMRSRPGNPFTESQSPTTSTAQPVVPLPLLANGHPVCAAPPLGQPRPAA